MIKENFIRNHDHIHLNKKRKIAFLSIYKCASTAIRQRLDMDIRKYRLANKMTKEEYDSYYVFSIIREPNERVISAYIETTIPAKRFGWKQRFHNHINMDKSIKKELIKVFSKVEDDYIRFKKYLDFTIDKGFFEPHQYPMNRKLINSETKRYYPNVHIFEMYSFLDHFPYKLNDKSVNKNETRDKTLKNKLLQYYNENKELQDRMYTLYEEDIKLYEKNKDNNGEILKGI